MIVSSRILLKFGDISGKVVEKIKVHFMLSKFSQNRAFYEKMWKIFVEPDRPRMTTKTKQETSDFL
jgi:hypothetical protein